MSSEATGTGVKHEGFDVHEKHYVVVEAYYVGYVM